MWPTGPYTTALGPSTHTHLPSACGRLVPTQQPWVLVPTHTYLEECMWPTGPYTTALGPSTHTHLPRGVHVADWSLHNSPGS